MNNLKKKYIEIFVDNLCFEEQKFKKIEDRILKYFNVKSVNILN